MLLRGHIRPYHNFLLVVSHGNSHSRLFNFGLVLTRFILKGSPQCHIVCFQVTRTQNIKAKKLFEDATF